jgi:hypothetical protein
VGVAPRGVHHLGLVSLDGEATTALDAVNGGVGGAARHSPHRPDAA